MQGAFKNQALRDFVPRPAAGIPEGEIREHITRYSAVGDDVHRRTNDDCRNTGRFKCARNQTHGLVTDRSQGDQQGDVDVVFATVVHDRRRIRLESVSHAVKRRHTVKMLSQTAQTPLIDCRIE